MSEKRITGRYLTLYIVPVLIATIHISVSQKALNSTLDDNILETLNSVNCETFENRSFLQS